MVMVSSNTGYFPDLSTLIAGNLPLLSSGHFGQNPAMRKTKKLTISRAQAPRPRGRPRNEEYKNPLAVRILSHLAEVKMSQTAALKTAKLDPTFIRDIERKGKSPSIDKMIKLADATSGDVGYLAFNIRSRPGVSASSSRREVPVEGVVAAGRWMVLHGQNDATPYPPLKIGPDSRYDDDKQFGLVVSGTSINKIARDGEVLLCVRGAGDVGDLVIVQRTRGGQAETTAKRVRIRGSVKAFYPESDDPQWDDEELVVDETRLEEGETIEIIALVIGVYREMGRR